MAQRIEPAESTRGGGAVWEQPLPWLGETESAGVPEPPTEETPGAQAAEPAATSASEGTDTSASAAIARPATVPAAHVAVREAEEAEEQGEAASSAPVEPQAEPDGEAESTPQVVVATDPGEEAEQESAAPAGSEPAGSPSAPSSEDAGGGRDEHAGGGPGRFMRLVVAKAGAIMAARTGAESPDVQSERNMRLVGVMTAVAVLAALGLGTVAFMAGPDDEAAQPKAAHVEDGVLPKVDPGGEMLPSGSADPSPSPGRHKDGTPKITARTGADADVRPDESSAAGARPKSTHRPSASTGSRAVDTSDAHTSGSESTTKDDTEAQSGAKPATTHVSVPGSMIMGYGSSRCVGVSAHEASDGSPLTLQSCGGSAWQKWVFASDGTVRSEGMCMDIANASNDDGATIQLARCNGGWAQKFNLNSSHDLVNTRIGMCVDAKDMGTAAGTRLQLWECGGTSNQKWHLV